MDFSNYWWQASEAPAGIGNSLRFRGAQFLSRTFTSNGDTTKYTISLWAKIAQNAGYAPALYVNNGAAYESGFTWASGVLRSSIAGASNYSESTDSQLRDCSAWYHFVAQVDTGQAAPLDRNRIYVNGIRQPVNVITEVPLNYAGGQICSAAQHDIGVRAGVQFADMYLADYYLIDGQALDPTAFGEFDANGVWVPKEYTGTYGTNGFYLDFSDPGNIGADRSGNGNNFTANGFELADQTSTNWDHMVDHPTQNYATLNPLMPASRSLENANLEITTIGGDDGSTPSTISFNSDQEKSIYSEFTVPVAQLVARAMIGVITDETTDSTGSNMANAQDAIVYAAEGLIFANNAVVANVSQITANDVVSIRFNATTGSLTFALNNVDQHTQPLAADTQYLFAAGDNSSGYGDIEIIANFGQQPFRFALPAGFKPLQTQNLPAAPIPNGRDHFQAITGPGSGADLTDPGAGNWSKDLSITVGTPTSEALARCFDGNTGTFGSCNPDGGVAEFTFAPDPAITGVTSIRIRRAGGSGYQAIYNGATSSLQPESNWNPVNLNGGTEISADIPLVLQRIGGSQLAVSAIEVNGDVLVDLGILAQAQNTFPNGLWWIKDRANSNQHQLVDSSRPDNSALICPDRVAAPSAYVAPAGNSVAWCWSCPDTFTPGQTGGIIVESARRNANAGFAMMDLSFPNSSSTSTIEHGLGAPVDFFIHKSLQTTSTWSVYHRGAGAGGRLRLDNPEPFQTNSSFYDNTDPDENVITFGSAFNGGDRQMVYAWASVPGYSAFGTYESNNAADGPYCHLGFRPAFVMAKNITTAGTNWIIQDSTRSPHNPAGLALLANEPRNEDANSTTSMDLLSNGFKLRGVNNDTNKGGTLIYAAFAENPFGGSNVPPVNAR